MEELYDFYIAAPLFTDAQKDYNFGLYTDLISKGFKVFLPQLTSGKDTDYLFKKNLVNLMWSRMVIAICDGADMDSGTSWECGKFHGHGKMYALRTDIRKSADDPATGINLMIGKSADRIFTNKAELVSWMVQTIRPHSKKGLVRANWTEAQYKLNGFDRG
jgi:nucleoside 2-deoxyribosyltransferase